MKKIRKLITEKAIASDYFFTTKDVDCLKKAFRILDKVGFKWISGVDLNDSSLFDTASEQCFRISPNGIGFGHDETYKSWSFIEKDVFDFFDEIGIIIESYKKPFDVLNLNCLSSITSRGGLSARIIYRGLHNDRNIVAIYKDKKGNESVSCIDNSGKALSSSYDLFMQYEDVYEDVKFKQTEMTIQEIEKALGVTNLKIVK